MIFFRRLSIATVAIFLFTYCKHLPKKDTATHFKKVRRTCDRITQEKLFYNIEPVDGIQPYEQCDYSWSADIDEEEKISMIKELLSYEGDTTLCAIRAKCYNPLRSQQAPECTYSTQVEALFLINIIALQDPYTYAAFPLLEERKTKRIIAVDGPAVKKAFASYRDWLKKVEKKGLESINKEELYPLESEEVKWY